MTTQERFSYIARISKAMHEKPSIPPRHLKKYLASINYLATQDPNFLALSRENFNTDLRELNKDI